MATTPHIQATLIETAQAQKEVTANEAFKRFDAILNTGAIDKDLNTPPGSPIDGDLYIIGAAPTGAWAGKASQIAYYDQVWKFIIPNEGAKIWVNDEDSLYAYYGGGAWGRIARSGGKQTFYVPALKMQASTSAGCSALTTISTAANQPDISTRDFDPSIEESAQFSIRMPKSWNEGTITAIFEWSHAATATNFGVVWGISALAAGDTDSIATVFGTAQEVTDTGGTTNALYKSSETAAITASGAPQENDTLYFKIYRKAASASDNLAIDARLHGVAIFYTTNSINED